MHTFMYNLTMLFNLRKHHTSLHFWKGQSCSALLHNLARTPCMFLMSLKLAQKSVSSLSTKLAISSVGYIRQPSSLYVYFIKTHTLTSLEKEKVPVVVAIGLSNHHKC